MYMFTSVHHEHVEVRNTSGWEENFLKHHLQVEHLHLQVEYIFVKKTFIT
jgi:hypothetical protein